jgi:hypothetical protein
MEGSLSDPDSIRIDVNEFVLKDVGNGAYTEYELGGEMVDLYDEKPELMTMKIGHLHTHHSMGTFFSGTDMSCLHENAPNFDLFLSIIVNTKGDKIAKIAFIVDVEQTMSYSFIRNIFTMRTQPTKQLALIDCEVLIKDEAEIHNELAAVIASKKKPDPIRHEFESMLPQRTFNGKKAYDGFEDNVQYSAKNQLSLDFVNHSAYNEEDSEAATLKEATEEALIEAFSYSDALKDDVWEDTTKQPQLSDLAVDIDKSSLRNKTTDVVAVANDIFEEFMYIVNNSLVFEFEEIEVLKCAVEILSAYKRFRFINFIIGKLGTQILECKDAESALFDETKKPRYEF